MQMYNGMTNRQRAQVLVEALPYIQKYNGKIVVVKYGGNAMINEELKHDVMRDMVLMSLIGVKMVLVHGGGPEISSMLKRVGKETEFVNGLRVTDEETSEIVQMVLAGKINKSLVAKLDNLGGRAMGICGMDGGLIGFYAENALGEFHLADLLASHIIDICFRHFSNSPFLTGFWRMPSGGWHVRKPSAG